MTRDDALNAIDPPHNYREHIDGILRAFERATLKRAAEVCVDELHACARAAYESWNAFDRDSLDEASLWLADCESAIRALVNTEQEG